MSLDNRRVRYSVEQQLHRRLLDPGVRVQGAQFHRVRLLRVGEHEFWRHVNKGDHRGERVRVQILEDVQTIFGDRVRARPPRGQSRTRSQRFVERVRVQCHVSGDRGHAEFRFLLRPPLLLHRQLPRVCRLYVSLPISLSIESCQGDINLNGIILVHTLQVTLLFKRRLFIHLLLLCIPQHICSARMFSNKNLSLS